MYEIRQEITLIEITRNLEHTATALLFHTQHYYCRAFRKHTDTHMTQARKRITVLVGPVILPAQNAHTFFMTPYETRGACTGAAARA